MNLVYPPAMAFVFVAAETVATVTESWMLTLANYGVAGAMLIWFAWRDKQERELRERERIDQQKQHHENLAASMKIADAFRTQTDLLIVGLAAMKTVDVGYAALLEKIKEANK